MASPDPRLALNKVKRILEDPGISSFNQHRAAITCSHFQGALSSETRSLTFGEADNRILGKCSNVGEGGEAKISEEKQSW